MAGFRSRRARTEVKPGDIEGSQGVIIKLKALLAVCGVGVDESRTVKVRGKVPTVPVAGVPLIVPVDAFRLSAGGSGWSTDQVRGAHPPELCNVVL